MNPDDYRVLIGLAIFYVLFVVAMFVTDRIEKRLRSRRLLRGRKA
jgi:hypothetical protein